MPTNFFQVAVGTQATFLVNLGPGPFDVVVVPASGTIFAGNSNTVTASNGAHIVASVPWSLAGFATSKQSPLWACTASGTISTGIALSTPL